MKTMYHGSNSPSPAARGNYITPSPTPPTFFPTGNATRPQGTPPQLQGQKSPLPPNNFSPPPFPGKGQPHRMSDQLYACGDKRVGSSSLGVKVEHQKLQEVQRARSFDVNRQPWPAQKDSNGEKIMGYNYNGELPMNINQNDTEQPMDINQNNTEKPMYNGQNSTEQPIQPNYNPRRPDVQMHKVRRKWMSNGFPDSPLPVQGSDSQSSSIPLSPQPPSSPMDDAPPAPPPPTDDAKLPEEYEEYFNEDFLRMKRKTVLMT